MNKLILIVSALLVSVSVYGEVFQYKYNQGEKYKIVSVVDENVYIDGIFNHHARILNKISAEVVNVSKEGSSGEIEADYSTSEERSGNVQVYSLSQEYFSKFSRDRSGKIKIDPEFFMPVVRDVPIFDNKDYSLHDTWEKEGYEVHDLRNGYGIPEAFSFPVKVKYKYLGKGEKDGNEYDIISIFYTISHRTSEYFARYPLYPVRVTGYSDQTLFWDNVAGKPYAYEEEFSIQFSLSSGSTYEFTGTAEARVTETKLMDKDNIVRSIEDIFEKENLENTIVAIDDDGVTITLENISFGADSAYLDAGEMKRLEVIGQILNHYPERDVLITGHTALAGTEEGRIELSRQRAAVVAEYLITNGIRKRDQLMIKGLGASVPVADNSTPEGMRRNRRVEITIVEN